MQFKIEDLVVDYVNTLAPSAKKMAIKILSVPFNKNYLKQQMQAQLARILFGNNGYFTISVQDDNVVQMANKVLHSDTYSKVIGR
jgi:carboxyl-terminal processing protease